MRLRDINHDMVYVIDSARVNSYGELVAGRNEKCQIHLTSNFKKTDTSEKPVILRISQDGKQELIDPEETVEISKREKRENSLMSDYSTISRFHFAIDPIKRKVRDLKSVQGTYFSELVLNESDQSKNYTEPTILTESKSFREGDIIIAGNIELIIEED